MVSMSWLLFGIETFDYKSTWDEKKAYEMVEIGWKLNMERWDNNIAIKK